VMLMYLFQCIYRSPRVTKDLTSHNELQYLGICLRSHLNQSLLSQKMVFCVLWIVTKYKPITKHYVPCFMFVSRAIVAYLLIGKGLSGKLKNNSCPSGQLRKILIHLHKSIMHLHQV
jgi:hypothetical protein